MNKIAAFSGRSLRNIVGQSECKVDLAPLVERNVPLIVDTDARRLGTGSAGLIGATLLELLACRLRERGEGRAQVLIVVDEFQLTPADWAAMVEGLRKFGGRFVLATQSLTALERTQPGLRGAVFGNQATIVCHRVSAEDARYLTAELDEAVERTDLINLAAHQAYVKTTDGTIRLPTFSIEVPLPPDGDPAVAANVIERSARMWGNPRALVEAAYQDYLYGLYMTDEPDGGTAPDNGWIPATAPGQGSGMPLAGATAPPAPSPPAQTTPAPAPRAHVTRPADPQTAAHGGRGSRKRRRHSHADRGGSPHQESLFGVATADQGQTS
jgi:hypothetical protein